MSLLMFIVNCDILHCDIWMDTFLDMTWWLSFHESKFDATLYDLPPDDEIYVEDSRSDDKSLFIINK